MYALFFVTIVFFHGVKFLTQSTSSSPTYMKLHNGSEDRQKFCVPSFSISYFPSGPVMKNQLATVVGQAQRYAARPARRRRGNFHRKRSLMCPFPTQNVTFRATWAADRLDRECQVASFKYNLLIAASQQPACDSTELCENPC